MTTLGALGEVALALSPWVPGSRHQRVDGVGAEWLGQVLARDVSGARIERLETLGGTTGTTDRRRVAVHWNDAGAAAGLPANVFLKGTSPSPKNRTMVAALWMAANEVKFYEGARPDLGDIAPRCYAARRGHGARFLLVLEDLVAAGAQPFSATDGYATVAHAGALMDTLASLHARFWRSPRLAADLAWAAPMTGRSGFPLLARQFRKSRGAFLSGEAKRPVSPATRRLLQAVNDHEAAVYRAWEDGPQTLVHGDSHFGNTFAFPDGRAGLLDWQVVFRTRGVREVAYFIPALTVEDRRANERALLQRYLDGLAAGGVVDPPSFDEAWDDYRFFLHDALDSCVLTLLWPGLQDQEALELSYERITTAVDDLAVDEAVLERVGATARAA